MPRLYSVKIIISKYTPSRLSIPTPNEKHFQHIQNPIPLPIFDSFHDGAESGICVFAGLFTAGGE